MGLSGPGAGRRKGVLEVFRGDFGAFWRGFEAVGSEDLLEIQRVLGSFVQTGVCSGSEVGVAGGT